MATYRNVSDFKTATLSGDLTLAWITAVQGGMNGVPHLPPTVSYTLALPKASRSRVIKDVGQNDIRLARR